MTTYFSVLPLDIIDAIQLGLQATPRHDASSGPFFIRLPHPRTGIPSLFLPSSARLLEVQAIAPPESRSWFLDGEVISDGKLLVMTPIDPVFILIPILQVVHPTDGSSGTYRPADDIFEEAAMKLQDSQADLGDGFNADVRYFSSLECVRDALKRICETKEVTPEIVVYRLSLSKVKEYIHAKVSRLAAPEVLETSRTAIRRLAKDGLMEDGKENLLKVAYTRTACDLVAQYLSSDLRLSLAATYDCTELDMYLKGLEDATMSSTVMAKKVKVTGKGTAGEEKKRKNVKESQGVEKLKKTNVTDSAPL